MKYQVLDLFFYKQKLSTRFASLEVDKNFYITDTSEQVKRFAYCPQDAIPGKDVRLAFPEFVGLEDLLLSILEGHEKLFILEEIHRLSEKKAEIYINIYIFRKSKKKENQIYLTILIEDITQRMLLKRKRLQQANEANL
ncbi:PAS fold-3 domain protein [Fischerella sp. NIES-4106]|nr:PAS fold-3 domain protein [Fischerella sp. NIES-4106]